MKRLLFRLLGQGRYLKLVSRLFFVAYDLGLLRGRSGFECHYYMRSLIHPRDHVIDIGANLGYYTVLFSRWVGEQGRVYAVEPVAEYREILRHNVGSAQNVTIIPYGIGERSGSVAMGVAGESPHRHGLTRVLNPEEEGDVTDKFAVELRTPSELFGGLERVDFIKCDVEGYEEHVLPGMRFLLERFRPALQIEIAPDNRPAIFDLMRGLGYAAYKVGFDAMTELQGVPDGEIGDVLFIADGVPEGNNET